MTLDATFRPADLSDPATFVEGVPHATYRWLREHAPVYWQAETGASGTPPGPGYWALTRHADVAFVSKHAELFSSEVGTCVMSDLPPRDLANMQQQLINRDPPRHTALRNLMNPHFKPGAVKRTEARMRASIQSTLDRLENTERCDFVDAVSAPDDMGIVLRTAATDADDDSVAEDMAAVLGLAQSILAEPRQGRPEKLLDGPSAQDIAWRDWPTPDQTDTDKSMMLAAANPATARHNSSWSPAALR